MSCCTTPSTQSLVLPWQKMTSGKPQRVLAMQIDVRVAEVGDRRSRQLLQGRRDAETALLDGIQKLTQVVWFHHPLPPP